MGLAQYLYPLVISHSYGKLPLSSLIYPSKNNGDVLHRFLWVYQRVTKGNWAVGSLPIDSHEIPLNPYLQGGAPPVISWFIIPITISIDITPINPSYSTYNPT